jgi:hypothetical protein
VYEYEGEGFRAGADLLARCFPETFQDCRRRRFGGFGKRGKPGVVPAPEEKDRKETAALLERTAGAWKHITRDGAEIIRELRQGSTRDVWGD